MKPGTRAARIPGGFLLCALALVSLSARAPSILPCARCQTPHWWEVRVDLKTDGDYRLDGGSPAFSGHYSFSVCWTGWLEKDDHDYLLYRLDSRLSDWKAHETSLLAESNGALTTEDFEERPAFALKYFIRDGEDLRLDFIVGGMAVPQASPDDSFALLLPSSAQNGQKESQVDYNAGVIKGSNRVELPESEIYAGPVAKTFTWVWKHDQWLPQARRTVFTSQSHRVEVSVSIVPRSSRPKGKLP